ncbi:Hemicentin-2, partial [Camelus dromedarius]
VVPEDHALYVCEAQNIFGKVQAEACLIMTGHGSLVGLERRAWIPNPDDSTGERGLCPLNDHPQESNMSDTVSSPHRPPPQIASSTSTVRVLERKPVSLPCIVLAGRPHPERRWLKAGR